MRDEPVCEVLTGGVQATVQDAGRPGYGALGVPRAGAMDRFALAAANLSAGNAPDAAAIEIALGGLALRFLRSCRIAIAGADLDAQLDGAALVNWSSHMVAAGARLRFNGRIRGVRAYLAIEGGITVAPVLGSRSTYLPGGWGGFEGRALRARDVLAASLPPPTTLNFRLRPEQRPAYSAFPTIRCIVGPHIEAFNVAATGRFFDATYRLSLACDRMGYRLEGPALASSEQALPSAGVVSGCIQIPPDGQPIVLMADAQTTGGYPILATVIGPDLSLLAQLLPGDKVRFQPITPERATIIARAQHAVLFDHTAEIIGAPI